MQRSREPAATAAADRLPLLLPKRFLWLIVVATTVAVPLTVTSGKDGFRLPKELLLEAGGILLAAGLVIALGVTKVTLLADLRANQRVSLLIATILVWGTIVAALSTQVAISAWLIGAGPDCFRWWYVPYKLALVADHPEFIPSFQNYREVHNDSRVNPLLGRLHQGQATQEDLAVLRERMVRDPS